MSRLVQHAKVRVVNEVTGREWIGYLMRDPRWDDTTLPLWIPETSQRLYLRLIPDYFIEVI